MIAYLEGSVFEKKNDSLIIMLGGVGLQVFVTLHCLEQAEIGKALSLQTHLIVREDLLALYGFTTTEEKRFFLLLLSVSGIGPKLAMSILSHSNPDTIRRAVVQEQPEFLAKIPGVGKKTAQKITLHLQGKIGGADESDGAFSLVPSSDYQVIEALTALGYSIVQAQTAVQSLPKDMEDDIEEKLRQALQSLG